MEREKFILGEGRYRDDAEIAEWRAKDPVALLAGRMIARRLLDEPELQAIDARTVRAVDAAEAEADAGRPADATLAERVMFAGTEA
jgi:TPP-dependent pyruvate/acetoin dehydrogenase alpha subunit